jgi:hypothetical protein
VVPITGCLSYRLEGNGSVCLGCQVGFNLVAGGCLQMSQTDPNCVSVKEGVCALCSNRFFFEGSQCVPVNPMCKSYDLRTGLCTDCYPGYMLSNGTCPPAPPKDPNCKVVTPQGCSECYQSYYVSNGNCLVINTLCKTSNGTTGECLSCYQGYSLRNGSCDSTLADPNCAKYDSQGGCLTCSQKYYKMAGVCTRVSPLCKTYSIESGSCLSCYPGYYLAGGACWAGNDPNLDPNCNLRSLSGECLQCVPSYYLSSNGYCRAANPLCRTFSASSGACLTCYQGYEVRNNTCALASSPSSDPHCLTFLPSGLCLACYASFYPSAGVCKQVNPLCRTANLTDGLCLSCYPGYALSAGSCVIPSLYSQQAQDPYCLTFEGEQCSRCRQGYFPSLGVCALVDPQCQIFDYANSRCSQCYNGYELTEAGCGVQAQALIAFCEALDSPSSCRKCMQGYYRQAPATCAPVSILCNGYDMTTGLCLGCMTGYFLQDGRCVYPAMGPDPRCLRYDASAYCSQCQLGYSLLNYLCAQVDPNCLTFNAQAGTCEQCARGLSPSGRNCI